MVDNFSPHRHPKIRSWCAASDVDLVFLPTYGSWSSWIETEFAALRYFAQGGTDYRTHDEQNAAIDNYIRWRKPEPNPRPDSPPTHPSEPERIIRSRLRGVPLVEQS